MATILDRFKLDGQVALVTGAGGGVGLGFAPAEAGADVASMLTRIYRYGAAINAHGVDAGGCRRLSGSAEGRKGGGS